VLAAHERFRLLIDLELRFDVLLAYNDAGPALKHHGAPALATVKVVGPEERARALAKGQSEPPDVRIKIDADRWGARSFRARAAVLAHELYHVLPVTKKGKLSVERDAYGRPRLKLIPDDWSYTGFAEVAAWYGEDSAEVRSYKALGEILSQGSLSFMAEDGATLSDKPAAPPPAPRTTAEARAGVLGDALLALISLGGYTPEEAAGAIERLDPAAACRCETVAEVVELVALARVDAEDARPSRGKKARAVDAMLSAGMDAAEARRREVNDTFPPPAPVANFPTPDAFQAGEPPVEARGSQKDGDDAPASVRVCNRCDTPRAGSVGVCPNCKSPEFRLGDAAAAAALAAVETVTTARPKRARKPKPEPETVAIEGPAGLFCVHPNNCKNAHYAVRAASLAGAILFAKAAHKAVKVVPDAGQVAKFGLKIQATVDARGNLLDGPDKPEAYERPAARTKPRTAARG
jgi:hypothetical protein